MVCKLYGGPWRSPRLQRVETKRVDGRMEMDLEPTNLVAHSSGSVDDVLLPASELEEAGSSSLDLLPLSETLDGRQESSDESSSDEEEAEDDDDVALIETAERERPEMAPCQAGAKVFVSGSTPSSQLLAAAVKEAALQTTRVHGTSSVGTPWVYARRLSALRSQNKIFLAWCRSWIKEKFDVDATAIRAPRTEPHIVKYTHSVQSQFKGLGTHQDGSFVTCIMALSEANEYSGGGTYFPHLSQTVSLGMGEVLLFQGQQGPYSAPHRAVPIASGKRVLYLAFFKLRKQKKKKKKGGPRRSTPRAGTPRAGTRTATPRAGMLRRAIAAGS